MQVTMEDIEKQKKICDMAGCSAELVAKDDCTEYRKEILQQLQDAIKQVKPTLMMEVMKIAAPVIVPAIAIYASFKVMEAKISIIMTHLKIG